jgi:16S rRNA processing protein RimM
MSDRLLEVGRIEKAHGLQGEVVVKLSSNVEARVAPGSRLTVGEARRGDRPSATVLEVEASRPHQHRFIVTLAGVVTREQADELHGRTLYAEPITDDDPDTLWIHELIGRRVFDQDGVDRGLVVTVLDNPASDLLELEGGGLVPLRFVTDHHDPGRLVVDIPPGLLDPED